MQETEVINTAEQKRTTLDNVEKAGRLSTKQAKILMVQAMHNSLHNVSQASKACGVKRGRHYEWIKEDAKYLADILDTKETTLDFVTSHLMKRIQLGDTAAIKFYLTTQGKDRGFVENPAFINNNTLSNEIRIGYGEDE